MKKTLIIGIVTALVLVNMQVAFAQESETIIDYETTVLKVSDQTNQIDGISVKLTLPNYIGSLDVTLETVQGTADATVQVIYIPNDMWDGLCYYSAVQARILRYGLYLFNGSTDIIGWKDLYSYGFLPINAGTAVFSPDSAELHFLQGPGLYTALISLPYTTANTTFSYYSDALLYAENQLQYTGVGFPFVLALNDDSINYFLEHGTLDSAAAFEWPGLEELLLSVQIIQEPKDEAEGLNNFTEKNIYTRGMFLDMPHTFMPWYESYVESVVRMGLMKGHSDGNFLPEDNVRLSEVIAMASRLHNIYNGGSGEFSQGPLWYSIYVNYAISNGIIAEGDFDDYERFATRAEMAYVFASAVPPEALKEINVVNSIRDVNAATAYDAEIFALYRAGVVTGYSDSSFQPLSTISRSECAAIIARLANRQLRVTF
ncbi:MAG: S-layer homology domain-containing protein [Clostridia bacterium]|nr:S-layer homology domain-containing protein [Clostridia bacterium]